MARWISFYVRVVITDSGGGRVSGMYVGDFYGTTVVTARTDCTFVTSAENCLRCVTQVDATRKTRHFSLRQDAVDVSPETSWLV